MGEFQLLEITLFSICGILSHKEWDNHLFIVEYLIPVVLEYVAFAKYVVKR